MYIRPTFPPDYSIIPLCEIPADFWYQRSSDVRLFLGPAGFWCQRISGASLLLVPAYFRYQPIPDVKNPLPYSCECIADVNTIFLLLMSIHLLMSTHP
jgi:hypothetical protein